MERRIMTGEPPAAQPPGPSAEMTFLEHLEELRQRILKGILGILLGSVVSFVFADYIINHILLGPARADFITYKILGYEAISLVMQSRKLAGQFFTYMGTLLLVGGIIGSPVLFYQLWAFIRPALDPSEVNRSRLTVAAISLLFFLGVSFGYFVLTPFALQFFSTFQISDLVRNDFDINEYFSALSTWVIGCGVIFQLPVIAYFFTSIGLITPQFLRTYRRHAIVANFIIAAVVTPPDALSQIIVAIPMVGLYELGIRISDRAYKRREKAIWGKAGRPEVEEE
jgi:sec-independent protein translocase protein TatC